jgi:uncharacterized protein YjbI with pentapeptide repeats
MVEKGQKMSNGRGLKQIIQRIYKHQSLAGTDLRNLYLSFMDFSGLELRRADLTGCCLNHALLDDCDLTDANLTNPNCATQVSIEPTCPERFSRTLWQTVPHSRAQRD